MKSSPLHLLTLILTATWLAGAASAQETKPADAKSNRYTIDVDTTGLPDDMKTWAETKLAPVCRAWYPKIVDMLPSEGFTPPRGVTIAFINPKDGPPAYTVGNRISCNINWFKKNRDGEAIGAAVHEMVHVVQQYGPRKQPPPSWLQEGISDYIRFYLYEPEKHGTRIADPAKVKYDNSYRVSANFLNWATESYGKDLIRKLNSAVRQGKYTDAIWPDLTQGKSLDQLDAEWKASLSKRR